MIRILVLAGTSALAAAALAQQPTPQTPPQTSPQIVAEIVASDFPTYDADKNALLDQAEFSAWLRAMRSAAPDAPAMAEADLLAWTASVFTEVDRDRSRGVDTPEMTAFLTAIAS